MRPCRTSWVLVGLLRTLPFCRLLLRGAVLSRDAKLIWITNELFVCTLVYRAKWFLACNFEA